MALGHFGRQGRWNILAYSRSMVSVPWVGEGPNSTKCGSNLVLVKTACKLTQNSLNKDDITNA